MENIILIVVDALRQDKVGAYGNQEGLTPTIDSIAKEGIIFEKAICSNTSTTPSSTSILTGQYSTEHGVKENGWIYKGKYKTIAEELKEQGYKTMAAVSVETLSSKFGLDKGFDDFYNNGNTRVRKSKETNKEVMSWLKKNYEQKFFCWIHYFDTHIPTHVYAKEGIKSYDNAIKETDNSIKEIITFLKEKRIYSKTQIVICADHGEMLGEHGIKKSHGFSVYDGEINVPLIMKNGKQERIITQISTTQIKDIMLGKKVREEDTYTQAYPPFVKKNCVRTKNGWKFILNGRGRDELYNLNEDPKEQNNLVRKNKVLSKILKVKVKNWLKGNVIEQKVNEKVKETLKGLGYI